MEIFKVTFFGHREIRDDRLVEARLLPILKEILRQNEFVEFYLGRNGEFDELAARLVRTARAAMGEENSALILVLPYTVKDIAYYRDYYTEVMIPDALIGLHPKGAITARNRFMVDLCDLVIAYTDHAGGAESAVRRAKRLKKRVIQLAGEDFSAPSPALLRYPVRSIFG